MTSLDIIVFGIFIGSVVLGLIRGLTKEIFSLAAWVLAFIGARVFGPLLAPLMPGVESPGLQHAAALVVVFVCVLVVASLAGKLISSMVNWAGLSGADHALGGLFGALRGVVAVIGLTIVAGLTALPRTQTWQISLTRAPLEAAVNLIKPALPSSLARLLQFSPTLPK